MAKYDKLHSFYETLIRESFNETIAEKIITNITKYAEDSNDFCEAFTNSEDVFGWFNEQTTVQKLPAVLTSFGWASSEEGRPFWEELHSRINKSGKVPSEHARINPAMQTRSIKL